MALQVTSLNKESSRLLTFKNWYLRTTDKRLLAEIGFYYVGPHDLVKCYFCNLEIGMWQPSDNPIDEHIRWSTNCPLILGQETTNEPLDEDSFKRRLPKVIVTKYSNMTIKHNNCSCNMENQNLSKECPQNSHDDIVIMHPEYALKTHRLVSFEDWPKNMKPTPKDLAEAGFYYTGKGDRVACFSCGGGLKDWEYVDEPWEQHAMWYSTCKYLRVRKGQAFIDNVLMKKHTLQLIRPQNAEKSNSNTPKVSNDAKETKSNNDKNDVYDDAKLCKICFLNEFDSIFLPCGHIIACLSCARNVKKCPLCNQSYKTIQKIFFS